MRKRGAPIFGAPQGVIDFSTVIRVLRKFNNLSSQNILHDKYIEIKVYLEFDNRTLL
jgi:hypothetical protein